MPTYVYRCRGCESEIDISRPVDDRNYPVTCPLCDNQCDFQPIVSVAVVGSYKQWQARKEVNFFTDNRREIARKQAEQTVGSGRFDRHCEKTKTTSKNKRRLLDMMGKIIKKAPPIKVDVN